MRVDGRCHRSFLTPHKMTLTNLPARNAHCTFLEARRRQIHEPHRQPEMLTLGRQQTARHVHLLVASGITKTKLRSKPTAGYYEKKIKYTAVKKTACQTHKKIEAKRAPESLSVILPPLFDAFAIFSQRFL